MLSAFGGGRFLGARYGVAPARVVGLHGWARTHADFDRVLAGLDAVAPDLPGFGATAAPSEAWGASGYADAVASVVREEAHPVVLVGHSFGGRVALMLTAAHPELVSALILSGVPLLRPLGARVPQPAWSLRVGKRLHRLGLISAARTEALRRRTGPADYREAAGVMRDVFVRAVRETDDGIYGPALAGLDCPVELVWGENDTAAPPAVAQEAAGRIRSACLTLLPGVGHLTPTEAPAALRSTIERHLRS